MQPRESPQRGITGWNETNQHFNYNRSSNTWAYDAHSNRTQPTSDFDLSFATITGPPQHVSRRQEQLKRNKRLFTAWIVKLNKANQLVVEGTLECGRRARSKPIAERLSASKILSKFKHTYYLVGDMADSQCELPGFIRHRFHTGFPQDWEIMAEIWKSFVNSEPDAGIISSCKSEGIIVEKKLKLAIDGCADNRCFMECARKVNTANSEMYPTHRNFSDENIRGYCEKGKRSRIIAHENMRKSIVDYELQDDQRSKKITDIKQLTGWTPFVVSDKTSNCCLVFRGTLLSSMGHAVNKNHLTDPLYRRLSPRIIETVNQEFYELIGDINNTKRDVPKELVTWCRYGCPKEIQSFCQKWRTLRSDEMKFQKGSPQGKYFGPMGQDQGALSTICREESANMKRNGKTNPLSLIQSVREEKKRKRKRLMELYNDCTTSDASVYQDTACNEKPDAILTNNLWDRRWPKIRLKRRINLAQTLGEDTDIAKEDHNAATNGIRFYSGEKKQQPSPLKHVPSLSYVYHRSAPLSESILSDGV